MALHDEAVHMQHLLDALAAAANGVVKRLWTSVDGDQAQIEQNYPNAIQPFLGASSGLAAQWYHNQAPNTGFAVRTIAPPPAEQLQANVRWAFSDNPFGTLSQDEAKPTKPPSPFEALSQSANRQVYNANRDTITTNANREKVMYARFAGPTACAFCRILATRGPVYSGKGIVTDPQTGQQHMTVIGHRGTRKPGTDYHDNCKCLAIPVRPGKTYHPPGYVDAWQHDYEIAFKDPDTHTFKDIVNHMRRQEYHADKLAGALSESGLTQTVT
jgi:hypothetical protein